MKTLLKLLSLCLLLSAFQLSAQKQITLENIWKDQTFRSNYVPGFRFMNDGVSYSKIEDNKINQYSLLSGEFVSTIWDAAEYKDQQGFNGNISGYQFNADESQIVIESESEKIYRRSYKSKYSIFDRSSQKFTAINKEQKIQYCTLSPDGKMVAYVFNNDVFYMDLATGTKIRVTDDGKSNHIINGAADWVYEEEFSFAKAFFWSPDSKKISFIRFDETEVEEFTMTNYNDKLYPEYLTFKYPKVGEKNAEVSVHIFNLETNKTTKVNTDDEVDIYIPRIKWTKDSDLLCVFKMNRHQNHLELLLAKAEDGSTTLMMEEKNKYYIDITDNLTFLDNGKEFIWTSEKSGYNHIYLYDLKGKEKKQITSGEYDVTDFYGYDAKNKKVYFQAAKNSPLQREIYAVGINGKDLRSLSKNEGTNSAQFSATFEYFVNNYRSAKKASSYTVMDKDSKIIRVIEDNSHMAELQKEYNVQDIEFITVPTIDNIQLNAWMIKPPNFDATKKYPLFMYVYGGPGSQTVQDSYGGSNSWWFQMLAQNGYVVVSVDNRGTGARGEEFKKMTYLNLGHHEVIDQIEAAKHLGSMDYIDESRIGIFGWSYGGYMSSLCVTKGADVFKSAIAVAPVTNWKWYDTIYTERYMRGLKENEEGYKNNSPVYFADLLKGNYLLVHGMSDDNVHFQNAAEMANALIKANKQFETYYYPNRNHGIYGDNARLHLYTKMTDFILEKL